MTTIPKILVDGKASSNVKRLVVHRMLKRAHGYITQKLVFDQSEIDAFSVQVAFDIMGYVEQYSDGRDKVLEWLRYGKERPDFVNPVLYYQFFEHIQKSKHLFRQFKQRLYNEIIK